MEDWRLPAATLCVVGFGSLRIRGGLHWVDREKLHSAISHSRVMVRRLQVLQIDQEVGPFHILLGTAVL